MRRRAAITGQIAALLLKVIAWAVPAVLSAVTVPAFAASGCEDVPGPSFAQLERCSISNPASGELIACLEWDKNYWWAGILDVGKYRSRQ